MARRLWRWVALAVPCAYVLVARCSPAQSPLLTVPNESAKAADNSNFILASLHAHMKSWSQAYAPNGRAMVPATIKPGTLLYHAGIDPKGMEWFAIDAEHSYGFGGGGSQGSGRFGRRNMLYTYAATRPLKAIYFDGFSAAKQSGGTLEMQNILTGLDDGTKVRFLDIERGRLLCEWGKKYGIQGFVREEATFELLWCDFEDGVQLLSVTNITIPADEGSEDGVSDKHKEHFEYEPPPPGPGGPGGPHRRGAETPYTSQATWSWYQAAAWHHTMPDSRVVLHPSYMVTLYDPKYTSLAENTKLPVRKHRLSDFSAEDEAIFRVELNQAMTAWTENDPLGDGSGVDWSSIAHAIVEKNGERIAEMRLLLDNFNATSNVTEVVITARLISFALIMPQVDHATVLAPAITGDERSSLLADVSKKCALAFTGHIDVPLYRLTPQEKRIKGAVEGVLNKICGFATETFGESLNLLDMLSVEATDAAKAQARQAVGAWRSSVEGLIDWLGWPMWQRCPRICEWDELCYVPMWPINIDRRGGPGGGRPGGPGRGGPPPVEDDRELSPRCVKRADFRGGMFN